MNVGQFLPLLLVFTSFITSGQEIRYFTRSFQTMTPEKTSFERKYQFLNGQTLIEDYCEQTIEHKATITGLQEIEEINAFSWYCLSLGNEMSYQDYFKNVSAVFDFYNKGLLARRLVIKGSLVKHAQLWDKGGQELLTDGTGEYRYTSDKMDEDFYESYRDSTLVIRYGVRAEKKDTIYYSYEKNAAPKEGFPSFYQDFARTFKYPGIARLANKEGRVYIEFVVDEKGKLTDFKPLSHEGFRFEARVIKKLDSFPNWNPATYRNRPVKTKYVLPVKFMLTD